MTDYGHDLLFGTFTTPVADPPMHAVDLAIVADRAGLDLVTFQDHPYQPNFHDTWTLLSYVASRTSTSTWPATCSTSPCGIPPCWPGLPPASTGSVVAASPWASAPARSGTRSRPWAAAA